MNDWMDMKDVSEKKQKENGKRILIMKRRFLLHGKRITSNDGERTSESGQLQGPLILYGTCSYETAKWTFAAPPTSVNRYLNVKEATTPKKRVKVYTPEIKYNVFLLATCYVAFYNAV